MAPFDQRRELLNNVYALNDDSMEEPRIEARLYRKGNKGNKRADRDIFQNDPSSSDDYPSSATTVTTTPALATSSSSIVYGSTAIQSPSLVCLSVSPAIRY
jgi:hypothetical protein